MKKLLLMFMLSLSILFGQVQPGVPLPIKSGGTGSKGPWTALSCIRVNAAGTKFEVVACGGGGGGTPGGSNKQVQYNAAGSFGGIAGTAVGDADWTIKLTDAGTAESGGILNLIFVAADGQQNQVLKINPSYAGNGGISTVSGVYIARGVTSSAGALIHVLDFVSNSTNGTTGSATTGLDAGYFSGFSKTGNSTMAERNDYHIDAASVTAGTLSTYVGFSAVAPTKSGGGAINEAYGFSVPSFTTATTNVGILLGGHAGAAGGGAPSSVFVPLFVYPGAGKSYMDTLDLGRKDIVTSSGTYCSLCFQGLNRVVGATTGTDALIDGTVIAFAGSTTVSNMVGIQLSVNPYASATTVTNNYGVKIDATVQNGGKAGRTIAFDATVGADGTVTGDTIGFKFENLYNGAGSSTFTGNVVAIDIGTVTPTGGTFGGTAYNIRTTDTAATNLLRGKITSPDLATTSAAQTGTLCWATGTGNVTVDTTTTCLLSLEELKDQQGDISNAMELVKQLRPFWFRWKESTPEFAGDKAEQPGLGAHQVAGVDKRLAAYDTAGNLHGVRYQELTAVLVRAIQELQEQIDAIREGK